MKDITETNRLYITQVDQNSDHIERVQVFLPFVVPFIPHTGFEYPSITEKDRKKTSSGLAPAALALISYSPKPLAGNVA